MTMFNNLNEIKSYKFVGNAYNDGDVFFAFDDFVNRNDVSLSDKAEALRILSDKGMGCGRNDKISDVDLVNEYLRETQK